MNPDGKIYQLDDLQDLAGSWRASGLRLVFTNGCFDLIHRGHVTYLASARALGDKLIVGVNSDASVKRLKGNERPIKDEQSRAQILASFYFVDAVVIFEEDNPLSVIEKLVPHHLVKGGDWKTDEIIGSEFVLKNGGQVRSIPFLDGFSSTSLIDKIKRYGA